jgi:hypothetical protein
VKKDLNLFTAYKNSAAKIGGKSNAGLFLLISVFVFIIAGTYGGLFLYQKNIEQRTKDLRAQIEAPNDEQNELKIKITKNELMTAYNNALKQAGKKFDASVFINTEKLEKVSSSLPAGVTVESMRINPQTVQLVCFSKNPLDPAKLEQALKTKNTFSSITYDGVVYDESYKIYRFNVSCIFNEAQKGRAD